MRSHENEPFVVNREVPAVIVPAGVEVKLRPGQAGYITQALGGSFTVYIDGNPQTARGTACRNPDGTWTAID